MPNPDATFTDSEGREWAVLVQWGHPAPSELGIVAVRFESPDQPPRVGFALREFVESGDAGGLRDALSESDPATAIG